MTFTHAQSTIWWSNGCWRAEPKVEAEMAALMAEMKKHGDDWYKQPEFSKWMKLWKRSTRIWEFSVRSYCRWHYRTK